MQIINLTIDNNTIDTYANFYFKQHPKARKKPIEHSYHPSINVWMILPRIQMNQLKQKWKDFIVWWIRSQNLQNKKFENFDMVFTVYVPTKRRIDCDNTVPKFILDGLVESGFIVDDDGEHLHSLTLKTGHDKNNPRTEIEVTVYD